MPKIYQATAETEAHRAKLLAPYKLMAKKNAAISKGHSFAVQRSLFSRAREGFIQRALAFIATGAKTSAPALFSITAEGKAVLLLNDSAWVICPHHVERDSVKASYKMAAKEDGSEETFNVDLPGAAMIQAIKEAQAEYDQKKLSGTSKAAPSKPMDPRLLELQRPERRTLEARFAPPVAPPKPSSTLATNRKDFS